MMPCMHDFWKRKPTISGGSVMQCPNSSSNLTHFELIDDVSKSSHEAALLGDAALRVTARLGILKLLMYKGSTCTKGWVAPFCVEVPEKKADTGQLPNPKSCQLDQCSLTCLNPSLSIHHKMISRQNAANAAAVATAASTSSPMNAQHMHYDSG